jgi:hypothetical protein
MLKAEDVLGAVATGGMYRHEAKIDAKFKTGDRVKVRNYQPQTHTRLPGYVRGKIGTVVVDYGVFVFPDTMANRVGEKPQHLYGVHFEAREVWGDKGGKTDTLRVDLFDDYLDACD